MSKSMSTTKNKLLKTNKSDKQATVTDSIDKVFNKKAKQKKPIKKTKTADINNKTPLNITSKNKI